MKFIVLFYVCILVFATAHKPMSIFKQPKSNGLRELLGEMSLTNEDNFQYYGNFTLGTPGQTVQLIMDTTYDQMWVSSTNYNSSKSTTANISTVTGNMTYGDGYVIGYQGTEMLGQVELFLKNVNVSLLFATSVVNLPSLVLIQSIMTIGVIGLSNNKNFKNFVEQAATAQYLNDSVFAFNVYNMYSTSDFYAGTPSFPSRLSLSWINCTSNAVWQIPISTISVSATSFALTAGTALFDTSISLVTITQAAFTNLLTQVSQLCQSQSSGSYYICDCSSFTQFPIIYFQSGTSLMQVGPKQYLDPLGTGEFCLLAVYPVSSEALTFGDSFLRNYFVAFDKANNRISYSTPNKPQ